MKPFTFIVGLIFWTWFAWMGGPVLLFVWSLLLFGAAWFHYQKTHNDEY